MKKKVLNCVIFIVVMLIPIIYSFFYLKSYWDPYGNLTDMKIGVVNLDVGENGENQGEEFLSELKDSNVFNINEVTKDEANDGLENGKYYAVITLPENFTKSLNSAKEENKQIANIDYTPNKEKNYLATQIINSAIKTIETNLQGKIGNKVVANLTDNLQEVPNKLQDVSDGSSKLLNGSKALEDGMKTLSSGTNSLNNKYSEFDEGISSANSGSKKLNSGMSELNSGINTVQTGAKKLDTAMEQVNNGTTELATRSSQGINKLQGGISNLNYGANSFNSSLNEYTNGVNALASGIISYTTGANELVSNMNTYISSVDNFTANINNLVNGIIAYGNTNPEELTASADLNTAYQIALGIKQSSSINTLNTSGSGLKSAGSSLISSNTTLQTSANRLITSSDVIKNGSQTIVGGVNTLASSSQELNSMTDGIATLQSGLNEVKQGTSSLAYGTKTLKAGSDELKNGTVSLNSGLNTLKTNSSVIKKAINDINQGSSSAYDGTAKLSTGVNTLKIGVDNGIFNTKKELKKLNGLDKFTENPVEFSEKSYGEVDSYGVAFTPLFLCIGLWVGSLMCYVVLYYDQRKRFGVFGNDYKNKFIQNILYIGLGAIQGLLTGLLLKLGLGFNVDNQLLYYVESILIGITFMSIIQFLIRNFGDIGKFLALIILVLQLAASGGTFPVETITKGFRVFTPFLPMTYSINALREVLIPTATNFTPKYLGILLGITIMCVAITYIVDIVKFNMSNKKEVVR